MINASELIRRIDQLLATLSPGVLALKYTPIATKHKKNINIQTGFQN